LRKHVEKSLRITRFAIERMESWEHSGDSDLTSALNQARKGAANLELTLVHIQKLYDSRWVPAKKPSTVVFSEGDDVRINEKYREKYLQVYSAAIVDNLVIAKCLPSGEIAVKHGSQPPFIVVKSHLERRRSEDESSAED
jgi:hypothetical protein